MHMYHVWIKLDLKGKKTKEEREDLPVLARTSEQREMG